MAGSLFMVRGDIEGFRRWLKDPGASPSTPPTAPSIGTWLLSWLGYSAQAPAAPRARCVFGTNDELAMLCDTMWPADVLQLACAALKWDATPLEYRNKLRLLFSMALLRGADHVMRAVLEQMTPDVVVDDAAADVGRSMEEVRFLFHIACHRAPTDIIRGLLSKGLYTPAHGRLAVGAIVHRALQHAGAQPDLIDLCREVIRAHDADTPEFVLALVGDCDQLRAKIAADVTRQVDLRNRRRQRNAELEGIPPGVDEDADAQIRVSTGHIDDVQSALAAAYLLPWSMERHHWCPASTRRRARFVHFALSKAQLPGGDAGVDLAGMLDVCAAFPRR